MDQADGSGGELPNRAVVSDGDIRGPDACREGRSEASAAGGKGVSPMKLESSPRGVE